MPRGHEVPSLDGMTSLATRIEAATPASRDRSLDGLRALAILGVVVGHWFVMALTTPGGGVLRVRSPLAYLPAYAPVSWVLHLLALFFLVGGYAGARSLARSRERGDTYRIWVAARLCRLGRPVVAATAFLGATLPLLALAGVPERTLRTAVSLVVQPLWFIAVYAVITALTPVALALDRRLGAASAAGALLVVAVVDALRYGPWLDAAPGWLGLVNVVPGWGFAYLLGVAWAHGRVSRRGAALLAAGGLALALLLVLRLDYPASIVGVPGVGRSNAHPPSLLVVALAAVQSGFAILARDRLSTALRRPRLWAAVAVVNLSAMTIFCWHQIALLALSGGALVAVPGGLPGLHDLPDNLVWVLHRAAWFPAYLVVLAGSVALARRFEGPWTGVPIPARLVAGALAAGFGVYALLLR